MKARQVILPVLAALVYIAVMLLVEKFLQPGYLVKSLIKLTLTAALIGGDCAIGGRGLKETLFLHRMKPAKSLYWLMAAMFAGVFLGFLLLRGHLDLGLIRERLMAKEGLTKGNCLLVFAYIIAVNSFLEEAFFRGFLGHALPDRLRKPWGIAFAALSFAVYHIGILDSWMDPGMLLLMTAGLAAVGAVLQWICDRFGSVKASWLVHACANLAINTIGVVVIWEL